MSENTDNTPPSRNGTSRREAFTKPIGRILSAVKSKAPAEIGDDGTKPTLPATGRSRRQFLQETATAVAVAPVLPQLLQAPPATAALKTTSAGYYSLDNLLYSNASLSAVGETAGHTDLFGGSTRKAATDTLKRMPPQVAQRIIAHEDPALLAQMTDKVHHYQPCHIDGKRYTRNECEKLVKNHLEKWRCIARGAIELPEQEKSEMQAGEKSALSFAVDTFNIGIDWNPAKKRLILTRPEMDGIISTESIISMTTEQKHNARDGLMEQVYEMIRTGYPQIETKESPAAFTADEHMMRMSYSSHAGIVINNPPEALLTDLRLDAHTPKRNDAKQR